MAAAQHQIKTQEDVFACLEAVIRERKRQPSSDSYVSSLFARGLDRILAKVGEEATETAIAVKGGKREEIVHEAADLLFHLLVLLGYYDIPWEAVCGELRRRFGTSGLEEKNSRDPSAKEPS